jgi:hypothetical protein
VLRSSELRRTAAVLAASAVALALAGCSTDPYLDNRDSVSLQFGDAVASNKAAQTIDPWPPYVTDTRIGANGQRSAAAVDRYHKGMILPPVPATTSSIATGGAAPTASNSAPAAVK